jgi:hypothetical protein
MAAADTEADEAADDAEQPTPWVNQTPDSRISGVPTEMVYADRLDDSTEQNDSSFGIVLEDPSVERGSLWVNDAKDADGTTAEGTDDDEPRPTDYRVTDGDSPTASVSEVRGETVLTTGEDGPSSYGEAESIAEDEVIVWFNGLSGQRISRILDFNGRPFATWHADDDEPYLMKGLYQSAEGWEDYDKRSALADDDKAPRVARAPILRQRVTVEYDDDGNVADAMLADEADAQRVLVDISAKEVGRYTQYRAHVFDADGFADAFGSTDAALPRDDDENVVDDIDSEMDMPYTPPSAADDIMEQAGYSMHMYTGDGWQDEPSNWQPSSTAGVGSFGVSADSGSGGDDETDGFTAAQQQFIEEVVGELKGTGMKPEEAFDGGLEGLIGKFADDFDRVPDAEDVRAEVYTRVAHLDTEDLE